MENKEGVLLGLVLGIVIGFNWQGIRRWLITALDVSAAVSKEALRFGVEMKERMEDARAEASFNSAQAAPEKI
ncbi:MAG: hypothetical protein WA705_22100 [Candidatus Ozemobacteraceae bacterium]